MGKLTVRNFNHEISESLFCTIEVNLMAVHSFLSCPNHWLYIRLLGISMSMELHKLPHPGTLLFPSLYLDCLPQWCSYYKWSGLSWGISLQTKDAFCCESNLNHSTERPHCPQRGSRAATCDCPSFPSFCCNQHWTSKKKCLLKDHEEQVTGRIMLPTTCSYVHLLKSMHKSVLVSQGIS